MHYKELLSVFAIALTFFAFYPYIRGIFQGTTKPHVFSWIIWASTTLIVFVAQIHAGGGPGVWPIGVSGVITALIAVTAYLKRTDITISRTDVVFFVTALSALPIWAATSDATWAVVVLTAVDLMGFGPTIRKVYLDPRSESLTFYGMFAARNAIVVIALDDHSIATASFPVAIGVACVLLILLALYRRHSVTDTACE